MPLEAPVERMRGVKQIGCYWELSQLVEARYRPTGREREAEIIRQANRAAAVGRLMLGELNPWQEFLQADVTDLEGLTQPCHELLS